jgi:streptomycin 3"-adenylyltransferase
MTAGGIVVARAHAAGAALLVARDTGRQVGAAELAFDGDAARLQRLEVSPVARGIGVGGVLLEAALALAGQHAARRLIAPASDWLLRRGFACAAHADAGWASRPLHAPMPAMLMPQCTRLVDGCRQRLGDALRAVIVHGSVALGGFHPAHSDLDVLVVVGDGLTDAQRAALAQWLLECSGAPQPIEISFVTPAQLQPWRHPAPFELHYGEAWRALTQQQLAGGTPPGTAPGVRTDPDLAAHVTVARARGLTLWGGDAQRVLPAVPWGDYLDAIDGDVADAPARIAAEPVYLTLNLCRVAAAHHGLILSKAAGARWGWLAWPAHRPVIAAALAAYRGANAGIDPTALQRFADTALRRPVAR